MGSEFELNSKLEGVKEYCEKLKENSIEQYMEET